MGTNLVFIIYKLIELTISLTFLKSLNILNSSLQLSFYGSGLCFDNYFFTIP